MNKLAAGTLEGGMYVYDLKTQHPENGFSKLHQHVSKSTCYKVVHLPQNRDVFATASANGEVALWNYSYPEERSRENDDKTREGVMGSLTEVVSNQISQLMIASLDWHPDKEGLAITASYDQCIRVLLTTSLETLH
eukprot:TRINITY_DN40870_c0_g1_i1.p2 TRINITY_DN40870_c0_g1~~TRINITY_DN40870_c0_g1_i1.p2  ORF type:complete len:136 (-),score=12.16 TRINITY_DN40870_c0_g1_i1:60-467(-)